MQSTDIKRYPLHLRVLGTIQLAFKHAGSGELTSAATTLEMRTIVCLKRQWDMSTSRRSTPFLALKCECLQIAELTWG